MLEHRYPTRIVNVRYTVNGLHFDAAIDCNWQLHAYEESPEVMKKRVPIELYCFDHLEWDINMEEIIEETKKWIEEELGSIEGPKRPENNEEDIMPLF